MERQIEFASAQRVKALIANAVLGDSRVSSRLGSIDLLPHQISASARLLSAIDEFGGALLADEVGMGKTFIALDVARHFETRLVLAPAALRDMWERQSERAGVAVAFQSFEALSRRSRPDSSFDIVLIDEAHHVRNPATIRYRELGRVLARARALMLTATPVHNSRRDVIALLALFLGSRAEALVETDLARLVVRRNADSLEQAPRFPMVTQLQWKEIDDTSDIPNQLLALPPPVPLRDGGLAAVLIRRALLRQWCSSDAALESALRRRLARSMALASALESGRYPSEGELSAWAFAEDSLQLAFPSLVAASGTSCADLLDGVHHHEGALRLVLAELAGDDSRDSKRARALADIRAMHSGVPIVAFSQYAATVATMFRHLRAQPAVAALTASGARVAGGTITRREALSRFAPVATGAKAPREIERITLLITTDLMSEGVNLQDAGVVVHLDLPWTAARLEQRLGRIRRIESRHEQVHSYGIRPIRSAELLVSLEGTVRRKIREAGSLMGRSLEVLPDDRSQHTNDQLATSERIRAILSRWLSTADYRPDSSHSLMVAGAPSTRTGFIAVIAGNSSAALWCFDGQFFNESPAIIADFLTSVGDETRSVAVKDARDAIQLVAKRIAEKRILDFSADDEACVAKARSRVLRRISSITQAARPHHRQRIYSLADSARRVTLGRLGAASESEMLQLASSPVDDDQWLRAISQISSVRDRNGGMESTVTALLILVPAKARLNAHRK